jgi:hypothetical protein
MSLEMETRVAGSSPHELEQIYQNALKDGEIDHFSSAIRSCYEADPDNLLYAAWYYRLKDALEPAVTPRRAVNWTLAIPLSMLTGLIYWLLSDFEAFSILDNIPSLVLWWSPIAAMSALIFLSVTAKSNIARAVALGLGLLAVAAYAIVFVPRMEPEWKAEQYLILSAIHIPLLCWIALGISVLGSRSSVEDRFAFLIKSIEVIIIAGLYLIAGVVVGAITVGMFAALSIELPEIWLRLIAAGGFGLLPVLAVASVYDPGSPPSEQDFDHGLGRFIATMMRLLLPLTLGVLVIYIFVIPFNFSEPFINRDVLIVYNVMLFGIIGLLIGATPISDDDLSPQRKAWLRWGVIMVATLAVLISIYALSAIIYRTIEGGLTINRMMISGWNIINIGILVWLVYRQFKDGRPRYVSSLHSVFSFATSLYFVWGLFLVLAVPWLFR